MQFESQLASWSVIYDRLKAAQERLRTAVEAKAPGPIELARKEVADLQAESDRCISAMHIQLRQR